MYEITGQELENHVARVEITIISDHVKGYSREVKFNPGAGYRVYNHGGLVLATPDAQTAAAAFNLLRPR